jgi:hypothetical protein
MRNSKARLAVVAVLCATFAIGGASVSAARTTRPDVYATTVTVNTSGKTVGEINSHYVGLSFESSGLDSGKFDNVGDLTRLLKNLGSSVLRFGGNSVDRAGFTGATASALAGLARLAAASGWTVLYSENLGTFGPKTKGAVTADARNVSAALGAHLSAIACGNEPDLYHVNGDRSAAFTESDYLSESASCLAAVRAGAPGVTLAGPDTATTSWLSGYGAKEAGTVGWLDQHYYPLGCAQGTAPAQIAGTLLSPALTAKEVAMFTKAASAAKTAHAHLRMSETNTVACGGATGLSDSYASALWAVDYMLTGVKHGVVGMNFHGGLGMSCQLYTPLCQVGTNEYTAQPIYYGMLFTHLLGSGHLLPAAVSTTSTAGNVAAFALRPLTGGGLRLIVENLSQYHTNAALRVGGNPSSATVLHLTGPSLLATSGVRIQGAAVAADGRFAPGKPDTVGCSSGSCPVAIAPYSAVLVTVG